MTADIVFVVLFMIIFIILLIATIVIIDYITASPNFIKKSLMKKNQQYCVKCKHRNNTHYIDEITSCSCPLLPIDEITGKRKEALCCLNYGSFRRCKWEPRD